MNINITEQNNRVIIQGDTVRVVVQDDTVRVITVGVPGPPGPQGPPGDADMTVYDAHLVATTDVHGIADTAVLETQAGAQARVDTHSADTTVVHGIADTSQLATLADIQTASLPTTTTGDLIVHGATEAVRLPVGAEGEALQVVSGVPAWGAVAGGVSSGIPASLPWVSGRYYDSKTIIPYSNLAAEAANLNLIMFVPVYVPVALTIDRISIYVTTAGAAGTVCRLGIYSDVGGIPTSLVLDAGDVNAETTGGKEIAIGQPLDQAWYWLAFNANQAVSIQGVSASPLFHLGNDSAVATSLTTGFYRAQAYGPFPATFPSLTRTGVRLPLVRLRAAV